MTRLELELLIRGFRWCPCHRIWSLHRCAEYDPERLPIDEAPCL